MDALRHQFDACLHRGEAGRAVELAGEMLEQHGDRSRREVAIDIAKAAAGIYREFVSKPVEEFAAGAEASLGEDGALIARALQRLFNLTATWTGKLREVQKERLVRELRAFVRASRLREATQVVRALSAHATSAEDTARLASLIGGGLGSLINHQPEVDRFLDELFRNAATLHLPPALVAGARTARDQRFAEMRKADPGAIELEWGRQLTQLENDIRNALPEKNKLDEPDEAVLRDVGDVFRSLARAPLLHGDSYFADLTQVLADFSPGTVGAVAKSAGIEDRSYNMLGFTAKKAVLLTMQDLGRNGNFTAPYLHWAQRAVEGDGARPVVEVLGALRSDKSVPLLIHCAKDKRHADLRSTIYEALGTAATPEASQFLLAELKAHARQDSSPDAQRLIKASLAGLGRVMRSPRTTTEQRMDIANTTTHVVSEGNTRLAMVAAREVLAAKPDELLPTHRHYAIRVLTDALWLADDTTALHQPGDREPSVLGFRHGLAEALKALVPKEPAVFIAQVEKHLLQYGGAYLAVAEVLEKAGSAETLPLLERMLTTALLHDDTPRAGKYSRELVFDPATRQRVELSKDKVAGALVFAIGRSGGEDGRRFLISIQHQIKSGRMTLPGEETARFLSQFSGGVVGATGDVIASSAEPAAAYPKPDPAELRELLKTLKASFFFSGAEKRRMAKIQALRRLAELDACEAVDTMCEVLGDKDELVVSAALASLQEMAMPHRSREMQDFVIDAAVKTVGAADPALRNGAVKLLKELGPTRPEVRRAIAAAQREAKRPEARAALETLLRSGTVMSSSGPPPAEDQADPGRAAPPPAGAAKAAGLEAKRAYLLARQAWISGGKKGPPPEPPPGTTP
jgi:HEAT repeat protein